MPQIVRILLLVAVVVAATWVAVIRADAPPVRRSAAGTAGEAAPPPRRRASDPEHGPDAPGSAAGADAPHQTETSATPRATDEDRLVRRLHSAIERGDIDALRRAIASGASPDAGSTERGGSGATLLRWSLGLGRSDAAALLLELGANPRAAFPQDFADAPADRSRDLARFLEQRLLPMTRGTAREPTGYADAVRAVLRSFSEGSLTGRPDVELAAATAVRDLARIESLLSRGVRPDVPFGPPGGPETSALHIATDLRMYDLIDRFVAAAGGPGELRGHRADRYTPLARAAAAGDVARIRDLLGAGVPPDGDATGATSADHTGGVVTPLFYAARNGRLDAVRLLADAGADVRAAFHPFDTVLGGAIVGGDASVVRELLDRGAPVRTVAFDAVFACVIHDRPDLIAHFVPGGPAPGERTLISTVQTPRGVREVRVDPLARAAEWGRTAVVRALLARGVPADGAVADLEIRPVEFAALHGRTEILRTLLDAGADGSRLRSPGPDGLDAAARAEHRGWSDMAELLAERTSGR